MAVPLGIRKRPIHIKDERLQLPNLLMVQLLQRLKQFSKITFCLAPPTATRPRCAQKWNIPTADHHLRDFTKWDLLLDSPFLAKRLADLIPNVLAKKTNGTGLQ
jgi:hypothetical protein